MMVNPAMSSYAFQRRGQFADAEELWLAIQANLRGLGYGG